MPTRMISVLLALAVAATATLAPAKAQAFDRDAQRTAAAVAIGIATIALIAKAEEERRKRERDRRKRAQKAPKAVITPKPDTVITRAPNVTRSERPLPRVYPRGHTREASQHRGQSVPSSCARSVETERGVRTAFGAPCLRRAGVNIARLPERCERLADIGNRDIRIWGARCLTRNGVEID